MEVYVLLRVYRRVLYKQNNPYSYRGRFYVHVIPIAIGVDFMYCASLTFRGRFYVHVIPIATPCTGVDIMYL